jgi:outer membrane protein assembly factor BamD (BamD/ComL family)
VIKKFITGFVLILVGSACFAQIGSPEKTALKYLQKAKWGKAKESLDKILEKDATNPGAHFLLARYYFSPYNPAFQLDSADEHVSSALVNFHPASEKTRDRIDKIGIDSMAIVVLRAKVDSAAFQRARLINTEGAFLHFLKNFPSPVYQNEAIVLRNEAAYLDAVKVNTYQGYLTFLEKYPQAARAPEARDTYERLLYEARTRDQSLESYESFLNDFPATPYRPEVERHIFEISTAYGKPE